MKITYTGRQVELAPAQLKKLEAQFAKVAKLLDRKNDREAHVILSTERHLHRAEVTVHYHNHELVGVDADSDLFTAIHAAIAKLEKQAIKTLGKWRDTKRTRRKEAVATEPAEAAAAAEGDGEKRVFRVNHHRARKPMTLDEAILEMDRDRDYLVYLDAETERVSMLVRRRDGHFDLVQA